MHRLFCLRQLPQGYLYVETEVHHVAIFDDVFLAFKAPLTGFLGTGFTLVLNEVVVGDDFGTDEAFFEVGVDHAGSLWRGSADLDGPGADFFDTGGEVSLQVQHFVAGADHTVQARLFQAQGLEEHVFFFAVIQLGNFGLDLVAHRHHDRAFFLGDGLDHVEQWVVLKAVFSDVGDVHHRLGGQQVEAFDHRFFIGIHALHQAARWLAQGEVSDQLLQQAFLNHGILVAALGVTRDFLQLFLAAVEVGEDQFQVDDLDVAFRVDAVGDVNHVLVFKAADHVGDGIGFTDVGQELVAQAFTFRRAGHQACDVDEFHGGRQDALWIDDSRQLLQARVRHGHDTAVGFDGAEGEVLRRDTGLGQGVEQGGFADVGQADDAAIESHGVSPRIRVRPSGCAGFSSRGSIPRRGYPAARRGQNRCWHRAFPVRRVAHDPGQNLKPYWQRPGGQCQAASGERYSGCRAAR